MITLFDLEDARPEVFTALADRWERMADHVDEHVERWRGQVHGALGDAGWHGTAADAAREHVSSVGDRLAGHAAPIKQVSAVLRDSARLFTEARQQLAQARQRAADLGLVIAEDGSVSVDPSRMLTAAADLPGTMAAAQEVSGHVNGALRTANDADQHAASALTALTPAGRIMPMSTTDPAEERGGQTRSGPPPGAPAPGSDPATVKRWWDSLSQPQKKEYAQTYPAYVGSTDGIPCAVRDYANRLRLNQLIQQQKIDLHNLKQQEPDPSSGVQYPAVNPAWQEWNRKYQELANRTAVMEKLQQKLGPENGSGPGYDPNGFPQSDIPPDDFKAKPAPKFLLGIDTGGTGHMIVASNNPDAAHNVATIVPGVGSKLDSANVDYATQYPQNLLNAPNGRGEPTSVIWWDDYDAPKQAIPDASKSQPAIDGAPKFNSFEEGLHATHNPTDSPHNTIIGHSYGSTLVGNAAKAHGIPWANDVVAIGSPGMDVNKASDLHVGSGPPTDPGHPHVWTARASNDVIAWAQDSHGTSPVREGENGFGANVFDAGDGPEDEAAAHGYYWDPKSPAMGNMAAIIAGNYGAVTAPPVKPAEPVPQPINR